MCALLRPSLSYYCCIISRPVEELDCNSRDTGIDFDGAERDLEEYNDYFSEMIDVSCLDKEVIFPKVQK